MNSEETWLEFKTVMDTLSLSPDVRAIVLSGAGDRAFTAGLDVQAASTGGVLVQAAETSSDVARRAISIKRHIDEFQECIGSVEKCEKRMSTIFCKQKTRGRSRDSEMRSNDKTDDELQR